MTINDVIVKLRLRYSTSNLLDTKAIELNDIEKWAASMSSSRLELFDQLAIAVALAFYSKLDTYDFYDAVINDAFTIQLQTDGDCSKVFWKIYEAFDAGEYVRPELQPRDPIETYTRPAIVYVLSNLNLIAAS